MPEAYRGLRSYRDCDEDRKLFFGRPQEKQDLLSLVLSSPLALLFSRAALGKTSLLNVALFQQLRERGFFPVMVRLTQDRTGGPVQSVYACLREAANLQGVTPSRFRGEGTLWEYFYDGSFVAQDESKQRRVVLIFDQFEELFTVVARDARRGRSWEESFIRELSDLVRGRVPEEVQTRMAKLLEANTPDHPEWERAMTLVYKGGAPDVKVVLSIREEFLPNLQALKHCIPSIFDNAIRLGPLTPEHAREAIVSPGQQRDVLGDDAFSIEPAVVDAILDYCRRIKVGGSFVSGETIDPVQLQIVCHHLDRRRRTIGAKSITVKDLAKVRGIPRVIERYYRDLLRRLPRVRPLWSPRGWYRPSLRNLILWHRPRAASRVLCEKGLVTPTGDRNSLPDSIIARKYGVPQKDLELLAQERLLQSESRIGSQFYELSHDTLAGAVRRVLWRRRGAYAACVVAALSLPAAKSAYYDASRYFKARPLLAVLRDSSVDPLRREQALLELSRLEYTDARKAQLAGVNLADAQLSDMDFSEAALSRINFAHGRCHHCVFRDAVLEASDLTGAELSEADLRSAHLRGARMEAADLTDANLTQADLRDANVERADFTGGTFDQTKLEGTAWWLAYGWRSGQIDSLGALWPAARIEGTPLFSRDLAALNRAIKEASRSPEPAALALNSRAWFRAIRGVQLDSADIDINRALGLLRTFPDSTAWQAEIYRPHFLDTRGLIRLELGRPDSAATDFDDALKGLLRPSGEDVESIRGEASYRLGLALCRLGRIEEAMPRFRTADSLQYRPTYELLLAPKAPQCAFSSAAQ